MNKFNVKLMSSAMLIAMMASVILPAASFAAGTVTDQEYLDAFDWAKETGLTTMADADAFMPLNTLSREAAARFLSQFGLEVLSLEADETASCDFSDLASADPTLTEFVVLSCQQGLLKGSNNKFMPKTTMTKAQFIVALVRGLDGDKAEAGVSPWYNNYCTWAQDNDITNETDCAALDRPVTRYEALLMLYRGSGEEVIVDPTDPTDPTDPVVVGNGEYTVSVSSESPKGTTLPGLAPAHVASFDIEADEAGKLASITLERLGLGNKDSIQNVTLYINGTIASKTRTFASDGTREFTLTPTMTLAAGDVVTVDVVATIGNSTGASNQEFTIAAIEVNGEAVDSVDANKFRVGAVNASAVAVTMKGSNDEVQLGDKAVEIASFDLKNNDGDYSIMIDAITLKDDNNNIRTNFENFVLEIEGKEVAMIESTDGKYLTFTLDKPVTIGKSKKVVARVLADVIAGVDEETKLIIDDVNFIIGHDAKYGYGIAVSGIGSTGAIIKVTAGDVSIEKIKLDIDEIRQDRDDNLLAAFDLTVNAGNDIELSKLVFTATTSTGTMASLFDKIEVSVDGNTEEAVSISNTLTFNDLALSIPTGKKVRVEVRGDTKPNLTAYTGATFKLAIDQSGISLEDLDENKKITNITPSSLSFDEVMIVEPGVKVSKLATSNTVVVAGQTNIDFFKFQIETDTSSSAELKEFTIAGNANFNKNYVTKIALYKDGESTPIKTWNGGSITTSTLKLNGLSEVVAASSTQKYVVKVDVTSNSALTGTVSGSVAASSFDFRDDDNNTVSAGVATMTTRVITIAGEGNINIITNNKVENNSYVVAGTTSDVVAAFEVNATNEDIRLKNFAITIGGAGSGDFSKVVSKIEILDGDTVINTADGLVSEGETTISINNQNVIVPADGSKKLFVRLVTSKVGFNQNSTEGTKDFTIALAVTEAIGQSSNKKTSQPSVTSAYSVAVVPVRVAAMAITDFDNAPLAAGINIAKLDVTAASWTNTKPLTSNAAELLVNSITLGCATNGFSGDVTLALRGNAGVIATGNCAAGIVTFTLPSVTDTTIQSAATANYRVVLDSGSFGNPASISINDTNANITFSEKNSVTVYTGLRAKVASPALGSASAATN